jgi:hypothetical protein
MKLFRRLLNYIVLNSSCTEQFNLFCSSHDVRPINDLFWPHGLVHLVVSLKVAKVFLDNLILVKHSKVPGHYGGDTMKKAREIHNWHCLWLAERMK